MKEGLLYVGTDDGLIQVSEDGGQIWRKIETFPGVPEKTYVSKIVASLSGPVTTARSEVDIIVTEFGAAQLRGQSLAERARRLVAIAHPDFREELNRTAYNIQKREF